MSYFQNGFCLQQWLKTIFKFVQVDLKFAWKSDEDPFQIIKAFSSPEEVKFLIEIRDNEKNQEDTASGAHFSSRE